MGWRRARAKPKGQGELHDLWANGKCSERCKKTTDKKKSDMWYIRLRFGGGGSRSLLCFYFLHSRYPEHTILND